MPVPQSYTKYRRMHEDAGSGNYKAEIELVNTSSTRNHFGRRSVARDHGSDDGGASLLNNWTGLRDTSLGDGGAASHKRTPRPSRQTLRTGWRMGALIALIVATTVCILNFSITMWVYLRVHGINSTTGILYYGNCAKARRFNVLIHLLVNVLGTLLLDASSYCMQVLSAPNRNELARAHTQRYWLHIGVPSWRNLKWIGKDRVLLWALLLLSSVPLHLLFNSVIVLSLQANEYAVLPVTEKWLQNSTLDTSAFLNVNESKITQVQETFAKYSFKVQNNSTALINGLLATYDNVTTQECFNRYSTQYVSTSGHVYLIHKDPPVYRDGSLWAPYFNKTGNFQWLTASMRDRVDPDKKLVKGTANFTFPWQSFPDFYPSNGWRCPSRTVGSCNVENRFEVPQDRSKWEPYESAVKYCLVERVQESCSLRFSFPIAIAVIVANFVKAICMALTLFVYRKHAAVVTVGDAIANFLDHPENATKGRCLHNRSMLKDKWGWEYLYGVRKDKQPVRPEELHGRFNRWFEAPSGARWLATYVLFILALIFGLVSIKRTLVGMPKDAKKLWSIGFGQVKGNNLLNFNTTFIGSVLVANAPQAALSYISLTFEALYTNMFIANEWASYEKERKPLRVSLPAGQQRSTYWLNVPFRFAIPKTIMFGLFHWLTSQSLFAVQITTTALSRDPAKNRGISTCGFSPMAIILTTLLGIFIAFIGFVMGSFRFPFGIPMASSCSAAISAGCHPPPDDVDASLRPVQWGAIPRDPLGYAEAQHSVGHCTFTSFPVQSPVPGLLYA